MARKQIRVHNADFENNGFANGHEESITHAKLINFAREVSIIGVRNLADNSLHCINKTIWAALLLGGFLLAVYQIQDRVGVFLDHPVQTETDIIQAQQLKFPQITICNENTVMKSVAKKYGLDQILQDMFPPFPLGNWPAPNLTQLNQSTMTSEEWAEIRFNLSQPYYVAVKYCSWAGKECDYTWFDPIATNLGHCLAFNTARLNLTALRAGANHGAQILLLVDQPEYLVPNSAAAGFRVLIHDPNEIPLMKESAFRCSPGFSTVIAISQEIVNKIDPPYGDCLNVPGYSLSACFSKCEASYIIARCQCKLWYMTEDAPICNYLQTYACSSRVLTEYVSDEEGLRSCQCPPQCHSNNYNYIISQGFVSDFFDDFYMTYQGAPKDYIEKQLVMLEIFFSTMEYKEITTVPAYSFMALLSDIGGALGLLLGATLLTVYEVLEFGLRLLNVGMRPRKKPPPPNVVIPVDAY